MARRLHKLALGILAFTAGGCGNVDWNWDATWWQPPRRTVRPIRPTSAPAGQPEFAYGTRSGGYSSPGASTAGQSPLDSPSGTGPGNFAAAGGTGNAPSIPPGPPPVRPPEPSTPQGPPKPSTADDIRTQSFYQLYLASSAAAEEPVPGTARIILRQADPRSASAMLEVLFPPMGRSGSGRESYLIYEQREEFDAARAFAGNLDVTENGEPGGGAFSTGVGMFASILKQDAAVDKSLVKNCQGRLSEAAKNPSLDAPRRWAAAVLAGRVAMDYTYEYPLAIDYFTQAESAAAAGSIEQMVARWWTADALVLQGKRADAKAVYSKITQTYAKWPQSQIVRRSKAGLSGKR